MQTDWEQIADWTAAYDNRAAVPTHEEYFYGWGRDAAVFRDSHPPHTLTYGSGEREKTHLFKPEGHPKGLVVFIHGGWWCYFGREYFSHLAAGAIANGWAVAMPSYTLCPDIKITGIVKQMVRAVEVAHDAMADGPLVIAGHSAGGHLATMMGAEESQLPTPVADRLKRIVSISGVADLRPLLNVAMNDMLKLDEAEARAISPLFLTPRSDFDYIALAGADETTEFRRQTALLATGWGAQVSTRRIETVGKHHLDVIDPLAEADSTLTRLITLG